MILSLYIAPGQGQTTPWGQNFDVNRNSLSLCPFVASLKKISLKSDFLPFFMFCVLRPSQQRGHVELIVALFLGRLRPSKRLTSTKRGRPQQ